MDASPEVMPSPRGWRLLLLTVFAMSLLLFTFAHPLPTLADDPDTAAPDAVQPDPIAETEAAMLARINSIRASYGLAPFTYSEQLNRAARAHVNEGAARNWLSHRGVNGSSYYDRVAATGYDAIKVNECIGWGHSLDRMVNWWMNSYVHRNILLSPYYTEIGIGYAGNGSRNWWVVNAARPAD